MTVKSHSISANATPNTSVSSAHVESCHINPDLPDEWKCRVSELISNNADIFAKNDIDVGKTSHIEHRIILTDDSPFKERSRPIAARDLDDARRHIQDLLDARIIRESESPYCSPIVLQRVS